MAAAPGHRKRFPRTLADVFSLPGLDWLLAGFATLGLGVVGLVLHLVAVVLAVMLGRGTLRALATTIGPVACCASGGLALLVATGIDGTQRGTADEWFLVVPGIGVLSWLALSLSAWILVGMIERSSVDHST